MGTTKAVTVTGYSLGGTAAINYMLSQPSGLVADITPPSASSDISLNSNSSTNSNSNIDYTLYQGTTLNTTYTGLDGSIGVLGFHLRDGGINLNDADILSTELTDITFAVTNSANIRSARLFINSTPMSNAVPVNGASSISFSGLTGFVAADNTQLAINLRVTFNSTVTDNQQIQFTITSATAKDNGSKFAEANAGGISSTIANDKNRIEVTADRIAFAQLPTATFVGNSMNPAPSVQGIDAYGNRDLDFTGTVSITSSGTLSSPQTVNATNGLAIFNTINHTLTGSFSLVASNSGFTSVSSTSFDITPLLIPTFVQFGSVCSGSNLSLPTNSINGVTGTWTPALNNTATTTYTFTPYAGQNAISTTQIIVVNPNVTPTFTAVNPICSGDSLAPLPTTSNEIIGITGTWSPAINNTATTTYTFTPTAGQCATTATQTIVVNPNVIPTFTGVAPITAGDTLAPLPTTSNEIIGITGTWSPPLNNTTTTTYTFTPNAGQCATSTTLTITVTTNGNNNGNTGGSNNNSASLTENYIKTTTYRDSNGGNPVANITYFDGLGRPMQQILGKNSPSGKDIVTHMEYDAFGRQEKEYLPFVSSQNNLSYIDGSGLTADIITQYQDKYGDLNPYSQKKFEDSPLNRVLKHAAPGNDWALGAGHEIKFDYQTNVDNEVKLFKVVLTPDYDISLVNGTGTTFYEPNQLYKTITYDENTAPIPSETAGSTVEFKDKEGHVVLKRTYESGEKHDTYYVYDDYGNLTFVIPPKAADLSITDDILKDLCYQYKYDYRNRLVEKKLPGKQWEFIVYDKLDRPVATGPALSPFGDGSWGWLITKYDAFNRVVYTGWENASATSATRVSKQSEQNTATTLSESKSTSGNAIDGVAVNYSNDTVPTTFKLLTVNYYDDYNYPNAPSAPTSLGTVLTNAKGLATGSWSRVLTTASETLGETASTFYDPKARPIRVYTQNYLGGYTYTDSKLDFTGKTLYTITKHKRIASDTELAIKEVFTYSDQDRLLTHTHQINNGNVELLASNTYDELGKLISKNVGGAPSSSIGLQKVDYAYNIRGWLTGINDVANLTQNGEPQDLFAFKINYNTIGNETNYVGTKLFNGNIAETYWRTSNDDVLRKYSYEYDNLNRLKNAVYQKPGSAVSLTNSYNESMSFDKNGNIQNLQRTGEYDDAVYNLQIDNLTYAYDQNKQNQLVKVDDTSNNPKGFKDVISPIDYEYDLNGNMTKDVNKEITNIIYNHLNLPTKIIFGSTGTIDYIYNANGKKLEKIVTINGTITNTKYLDGFQYINDVLQFFPHAEGYVNKTGTTYNYVYNYTDHLGNIRLSYAFNTEINELTILEESNYYPFGLKHGNYNMTKQFYDQIQNGQVLIRLSGPLPYKYKYNGKELQDELGLNWYDYQARNYDPALGRWMNIDPLAEKSRRFSPYTYALNNPIYFIDPDGMMADGWIEHTDSAGKQSVTYDAQVTTVAQAKEKGYTDVKQVLPEANVTNNVNGDKIALNKDGTYSVNGGEALHPADQSYTTAGGAYINENKSALSQLAPVLSGTGDAAVGIGALMVLTGVGAPIGAAMITYGGYASTTGTVMDIGDDVNNPNVTGAQVGEKIVTKAVMTAIPEVGGSALNSIYGKEAVKQIEKVSGTLPAKAALNAISVGADHAVDEMRNSNAGPYR